LTPLVELVLILVIGVTAQWLAWRLRLPSILLLLVFGFVAGPITGLLNPDKLLGNLLFPWISVSVAIILFEGGLSLKFRELKKTGGVVRNLVLIGVPITWAVTTWSAWTILGLDFKLALLLGAILVVTGPTVIGPLLRHLRPSSRISSILKWEAIINDPLGVILAILVFEAILAGGFQVEPQTLLMGLLKTSVIGIALGVIAALMMVFLLKRYLIPDYLQSAVSLMMAVGVFSLSNQFQAESGLLAVTVMGILIVNQKDIDIQHIIEFKENLRVLLISSLFIILAARLDLIYLTHIEWSSWIFLAILVFVARPLAVLISTLGSGLNWKEKLFLSWMAPRGIIAAFP